MTGAACPIDTIVTHDHARDVYKKLKRDNKWMTDAQARREAARIIGVDYDTYLKAWKKPSITRPPPPRVTKVDIASDTRITPPPAPPRSKLQWERVVPTLDDEVERMIRRLKGMNIEHVGKDVVRSVVLRDGIPQAAYRTPNGAEIRLWINLSKAHEDELLEIVDDLYRVAPSKLQRHLQIDIKSTSDVHGPNTLGETLLGQHSIKVFRNAFSYSAKHDPSQHVPSAQYVSGLRYTLTHEWGHAIDNQQAGRSLVKHHHQEGTHLPFGGLSRYASSNDKEFFAEAFAEWVNSRGKTSNRSARELAQNYGWGHL